MVSLSPLLYYPSSLLGTQVRACPYYQLERADLASQLSEVYGITWTDLTKTQRLHIMLLGNGMPRAVLEDYQRRGGGSAVLRLVRRFIFWAHTRRELALEDPVAGGI